MSMRVLLLVVTLLSGISSSCSFLAEEGADVEDQLGTIEQFGDHSSTFVIRPKADPTIAYWPTGDLPEAFRQSGLRVCFSGNIKPFPEDPVWDSRYPLLEVTEIEHLE